MRASLRYTQTVHALTMEREELGLEWGCGGGLSILSTTAGVPQGKSGHLIQKHFMKQIFSIFRQTNNVAEIQAGIVAIRQAVAARRNKLLIHTDSQFLISCVTQWMHGWKVGSAKSSYKLKMKLTFVQNNLHPGCNTPDLTFRFPRKRAG